MRPLDISKKQFVWWVIVSTLAFGMWLAPGDFLWYLSMGILAFSQFIIMTPAERSRPLASRDFLFIGLGLLVLIGFCVAVRRWLPEDVGIGVIHILRHPAFVIPFWALCVWLVYRRWRLSERHEHNVA